MASKKTLQIVLVTLMWSIYIFFPLIVTPISEQLFEHGGLQLKIYILLSLLSIGFYYINYYWAIPAYYLSRKYLLFSLMLIGFMAVSYAMLWFFVDIFSPLSVKAFGNVLLLNRIFFSRFIFVILLAFVIKFYTRYKQMESEKIKAELSVLKHQINPHFLFNVLNDIYGQAITKSGDPADSILRLSELMRYVLSEAQYEKVSLEKEIHYLENYIALQKRRLTEKTKVEVRFTGNFGNKQIPPLLFINFIENAFKHGVSTETESSIFIGIEIKNNLLEMKVKNGKPVKSNKQVTSNYIGLENTRRRLDLLYNNKHELKIVNEKEYFLVTLSISLA